MIIHILLSILDLGIGAAAGAAAAAAGAHVNGNAKTALVLQYGALGGVMKSGVINLSKLISMTTPNLLIRLPLLFVGSTFGAAVLITLAISQKVLLYSKWAPRRLPNRNVGYPDAVQHHST